MAEAAQYPSAITTQLYEAVARKSTTLTADLDNSNTTITVAATTGFPSEGFISIDNETIYYSGLTATTFTGCSRGYAGTAVSHDNSASVKLVIAAAGHNRMRLEIIAAQKKIGISGSTLTTTVEYKLRNLPSQDTSVNMVTNLNAQYLGGSTESQLNVGFLGGSTEGQLNADKVDGYDLVPDIAGGWFPAGETWTYASADDPTYTFTIAGDVTGKYSAGMKLKLTQTTAKYFIITKVAYSSPNTTVTIYGGTDYDLADAAITSPYYSTMKAPLGFPLDPDKWTVEVTDTTKREQASPTQNTWYNLGSLSISVPIGVWSLGYYVSSMGYKSAAGIDIKNTLSTANNSESNAKFTHFSSGYQTNCMQCSRFNIVNLVSKTTYYINTITTTVDVDYINNRNDAATLILRAVCTHL